MEKIIETKICKHCGAKFEITDKDLEFYEKVSPIFSGKKYKIPTPSLCPDCRQQRRLAFRNERKLYKRKCDLTGKDIISVYSPDKNYKVYDSKEWWSDKWDAMDYGKDFDFKRGFFEQFEELFKKIPQMSLFVSNNNMSDYVNYSANVDSSYLIFASSKNKKSMYSRWIMNCQEVIDSNNCRKCENCYECIDCLNLFNGMFCIGCIDSSDCYASYDLVGCSNCIGCSLLRNKSYYILNKSYSKEDYFKKKQEININKQLLDDTIKKGVHKMNYSLNSNNCIGEYIINSNNVIDGFDIENCENCENCKNISNALNLKDSQDICFQAFNDSLVYESIGLENTYKLLFSYGVLNGNNIIYSIFCLNGDSNCFGCVGLRNKSYCILNKQYTKEEYEELVPKIIEHMTKIGEWGEFFPASISPFGYNETVAQEYFPLKKEEVIFSHSELDSESFKGKNLDFKKDPEMNSGGQLLKGKIFNWSNYEAPFPKVEKIIPANKLPENIKDIPDDILNRAIECEITKKPFRIIKQELEFYRKHNLPIPRRHPDQRHKERIDKRNPRKLYDRVCDKCGKKIKTTYAPNRPEIVYCEECYNKEIY